MRKSERLRLLEIEFVKLQMQVDLMSSYVVSLLEAQDEASASLESGKWYNKNS